MILRWFRTYDEYGIKSEWELQYWSNQVTRWVEIPLVECKEADEQKFLREAPDNNTYWVD